MEYIVRLFTQLIADNFTGSLSIHFFKGGIGKIEKHDIVYSGGNKNALLEMPSGEKRK